MGGSFSIQKFILQIFAIIDDTLVMNFGKKLQYDFPKIRGGGSKAVWNFSENSSVLELSGIPYQSTKNEVYMLAHHRTVWLCGIFYWDIIYNCLQKYEPLLQWKWDPEDDGMLQDFCIIVQHFILVFLLKRIFLADF